MKKNTLGWQRLAALFVLSLLIMSSCGIETFVYLYPPRRNYENSNSDDDANRYCEFKTADSTNSTSASAYFRGTEIYYRIYENEADCSSDITVIDKRNEDNPSGVALYVLETKKYALLGFNEGSSDIRPLITSSAADRTIRFRLEDYGGTADPAKLRINGSIAGTPCRSRAISGDRLFKNTTIQSSDSDVTSSSTPSLTHFFVNFYAVSYGYDQNFRTVYSSIAHLGFIKIDK